MPASEKLELLRAGVAIPASPLALDSARRLDERHQRALYRYYAAAGSGGIAVAVHTTQFEIRDPGIDLFDPLLDLAAEEIDSLAGRHRRPILKIAGICGETRQAVREAETAADHGYDAGLLSLAALRTASDDELLAHAQEVARVIPLIGFYLQPAVGGRVLSHAFWRQLIELPNLVAVKIAPFNRYQTLDVVRAVALSGRASDIALYTGNDDNIIGDLLNPFPVQTPQGRMVLRIRGGLLGQWSVWTRTFVRLLEEIHAVVDSGDAIPHSLLQKNVELTDANSVLFDAAHQFSGCIPGLHEILYRQGLLATTHCINPEERLSPGQAEEIDRILRDYPWLPDDEFVAAYLHEWLQ